MENLAVSSQLFTPSANASNVEAPNTGAAADVAADVHVDGKFGALLAKQIALIAPQDRAAAIAAVLKEAKDAGAADAGAGAASPFGLVPQGVFVDPALAPMQKFLPANLNVSEHSRPGLAEALANITKVKGGKDLPVGDAKPLDVAATADARTLTEPANDPRMKEAGLSQFAAVLAEKKADIPLQDDSALQAGSTPASQADAIPVPQLQASVQPTDRATDAQPAVLAVPQRIDSENWGAGLGDKVVWMVGNQTRSAEIHINPPALGPLEVRVNIADGQANLSFMTHHAAVREAIEAATPKLREMLGDTGISMGSVSVNVGSFAQQQQASSQQQEQSRASWPSAADSGTAAADTFTTFVQPLRGRGVVDLFA